MANIALEDRGEDVSVTQRKHVEVVAAVVVRDTAVLCVQRGASGRPYIAGKWEFPGGKIERGENHTTALAREIAEELQVSIEVLSPLLTVNHDYPDFDLTMHAYQCAISSSTQGVVLTEHVDLRWLNPADPAFTALDWAAADLPIVNLLRDFALRTSAQR